MERELEERRRAVLEENARLEAELIAQIPVMPVSYTHLTLPTNSRV